MITYISSAKNKQMAALRIFFIGAKNVRFCNFPRTFKCTHVIIQGALQYDGNPNPTLILFIYNGGYINVGFVWCLCLWLPLHLCQQVASCDSDLLKDVRIALMLSRSVIIWTGCYYGITGQVLESHSNRRGHNCPHHVSLNCYRISFSRGVNIWRFDIESKKTVLSKTIILNSEISSYDNWNIFRKLDTTEWMDVKISMVCVLWKEITTSQKLH